MKKIEIDFRNCKTKEDVEKVIKNIDKTPIKAILDNYDKLIKELNIYSNKENKENKKNEK